MGPGVGQVRVRIGEWTRRYKDAERDDRPDVDLLAHDSLLDPLIIMFSVPLGMIGVIWALYLTRTTLNVTSFMGIIMMVGIVVSNGVLLVEYMNELGWGVYSFDHEGGDGQYEFDFGYTEAVEMCDRMMIFKLMSKHVARTLGCIASYMPKPTQSSFGSGAHFNMSLADIHTGANVFDAKAPAGSAPGDGYTKLAYQFTAGILEHSAAITAVLAPTVNSYKRLLPRGLMKEISWAPVYAAYGYNNRTLMCRMPVNRQALEIRIADSAVNFYLGAALTIAAGLDGIRRGLAPGEPVNYDTYSVSEKELADRGVKRLPVNLGEAISAFEADPLIREVLGDAVTEHYAGYKADEWLQYNTVVSKWERDKYLQQW